MRKNMFKATIIFAFIYSILFFQNCSNGDIRLIGGIPFDNTSNNNGGAYGGMTNKVFEQFVPSFTCENKSAAVNVISITGTLANWKQNKSLKCDWSDTKINTSDLDTSVYQSEIIGYGAGIYEGVPALTDSIPANLVEIWCHVPSDPIEVISHYDSTQQLAVSRVYYKNNLGVAGILSDFSVARTLTQTQVEVRQADTFDLIVYRNQPSALTGLFKAKLKVMLDGSLVEKETSCRLGASIDPSVWPVKTIVDFPITNLKISSDLGKIAYETFNPKYGASTQFNFYDSIAYPLYSGQSDGQSQLLVSKNPTQSTNLFQFNSDNTSLFFSTNTLTFGGFHFWTYDYFKQNINTINTSYNAYSFKGIGLALDTYSRQLLLNLNQGSFANVLDALVSFPDVGGQPNIIWAPPNNMTQSNNNFNTINNYRLATTQNKALILFGSPGSELYSVDLNNPSDKTGKNLTPKNFSFPTISQPTCPGICLSAGSGLGMPSQSDYIAINVLSTPGSNFGFDPKYSSCSGAVNTNCLGTSLFDINGSWSINVGANMTWTQFSPTGNEILLRDIKPSERFALSLRTYTINDGNIPGISDAQALYLLSQVRSSTPTLRQIPMLSSPLFSQDSNSVIGGMQNSMGQYQAVAFDISSGRNRPICNQAMGTSMKINEVSFNQFLITAFRSGILTVYKSSYNPIQGTANCQQLNTAISNYPVDSIKDILLSPDKSKMVVTLQRTPIITTKFHELIYLPLQGSGIPVTINSPTHLNASISQVSFIKNSNGVIFFGDQTEPNIQQLYFWH